MVGESLWYVGELILNIPLEMEEWTAYCAFSHPSVISLYSPMLLPLSPPNTQACYLVVGLQQIKPV